MTSKGRPPHPLWQHFTKVSPNDELAKLYSVKSMANDQHYNAWCNGCLLASKGRAIEAGWQPQKTTLSDMEFQRHLDVYARKDCPHVRGVTDNMVRHLRECPNLPLSTLGQLRTTIDAAVSKKGSTLPTPSTEEETPHPSSVKKGPVQSTLRITPQLCCDVSRQFLQIANQPTRQLIVGSMLEEQTRRLDQSIKHELRGKEVTLISDGWNNIKHEHLVAFLLLYRSQGTVRAYSTGVKDVSSEAKTGINAHKLLMDERERIEKHHDVKVICVCTDAGSDFKMARRLLHSDDKTLINLDCSAHQINLIRPATDFSAPSTCSSGIHGYTASYGLSGTFKLGQIRSIIRPVVTRWTSHDSAARRFLDLQEVIIYIIRDDSEERKDLLQALNLPDAMAARKMPYIRECLRNRSMAQRSLLLAAFTCRLLNISPTMRLIFMMEEADRSGSK
ncbi:hypothetical protein B9479_007135 [Cryptococcus floricola]|uniref:DUF659 domain-containing protein n=1 Tax=Cryptococcus floricola TaxID=2591691 RepID=A0A5D3AQ22_9TREE|nr:hypothetical protein B9479_007135 [Cryptococcus floricola]